MKMKFFPEFGSCLGGVISTPTAASTGDRQRTVEDGGDFNSHGHGRRTSQRTTKRRLSGHWKPNLHVISENSPMFDALRDDGRRRSSGIDGKKRPVKAKSKSPPTLSQDYCRQFSQTMAMPAFSPTSYLF